MEEGTSASCSPNDQQIMQRASSEKLKWVVVGVAVSLLISSIILVAITLKMAPIIDEIGELIQRIYFSFINNHKTNLK